ncbi:MAG: hypothetical protein Nkreftii_002669 [Candidatus Nitrospira kreftii]|uniref:Uncharacterized protein n=1 Tax=Candidatus Nitrospira kreftii TaxID=2652173 RepID=A0A7S8FFF5_9BACT|nr:MAG: hypothetical protein Nkreftii_002669 [Candidatus Nitrospira kreftii]
MSFRIQFHNSETSFRQAERLCNDDWIDTSFSQNPRAIGPLRLPDPGRFESKRHPILDQQGATVGYLVDGMYSLGYPSTCVYAGDCLWIAHQPFMAVASRYVPASRSSMRRADSCSRPEV